MKNLVTYVSLFTLTACGNPSGISDAEYAEYKELGAPKILYACIKVEWPKAEMMRSMDCININDQRLKDACIKEVNTDEKPVAHVGFTAGVGANVTYNKLLNDAKAGCDGTFKILESKS